MAYRSPGVFNREIDDSLYAQGGPTSVAGMVGVATKGPVGEPVLVTSWPQFQEVFGGFRNDSYLPIAAKGFFDEGGSTLYVVRTAHYTDVTDAGTLTADTATSTFEDGATSVVLNVHAVSQGTWANGLQVTVTTTNDLFDLEVLDADGNLLERFRSLSMDPDDEFFVENVVNFSSLYVQAEAVATDAPATATQTLAGGDDGLTSLADADFIGDAGAQTGIYAFDSVENVALLAIPGVSSVAVHNALAQYVEGREYMFAVLGAPQNMSPQDVMTHRGSLTGPYASLYWPWIRMPSPANGLTITVPVEGHVLGVIAGGDRLHGVWGAPAGLTRGRIRSAIGVEYDSSQGERDELYDDSINVIASFRGQGTVLWGQKTLTARPSALDRVNVRRLLNHIKSTAADTSRYLLFEPNDERTWEKFTRFMEPFLQNIRQRRGLMDYRVVCDATTNTPYYIDRNQMVAKIFIKPTKAAEFIEIQYIVTGSGVDFDES